VIVDYGQGKRRRGWIDGHIPSSQGGTPGYWVEFDDAELLRGAGGEMQPASTTFLRLSGEDSTYLDMTAADAGVRLRATIRRERDR